MIDNTVITEELLQISHKIQDIANGIDQNKFSCLQTNSLSRLGLVAQEQLFSEFLAHYDGDPVAEIDTTSLVDDVQAVLNALFSIHFNTHVGPEMENLRPLPGATRGLQREYAIPQGILDALSVPPHETLHAMSQYIVQVILSRLG